MTAHRLRIGLSAAALILAVSTAQADSTLLGLWRFEGDLNDSSGNGFHGTYGTLSGVSSFTPGGTPSFSTDTPPANTFGTQSLDLSANSSASPPFVVNVGNSSVLNPTDEMTLAAWYRSPVTSGPQAFVDRSDGTNDDRAYSFHVNSQSGNGSLATNWTRPSLTPHANVNTDLDGSGTDFNDDVWHHVAVTVDTTSSGGDGILRMYVDGVFEAQSPASEFLPSIHTNALDTIIGAFGDGTVDNQTLLDDVALFRGALTVDEINTIRVGDFSAFLPPEVPEPGSVMLWSACAAAACFFRWRRWKRNG